MPNINRSQAALRPTPADVGRRWAWIGLLGGASIGFSLVFACATPFVAQRLFRIRPAALPASAEAARA
jgi:hypothetical protein